MWDALHEVAIDEDLFDIRQALEQAVAQYSDTRIFLSHFFTRNAEGLAHANNLVRRQRS